MAAFRVDVDDEVVVGGDEGAVLQFEEDVGGGVVDGGDDADDRIVRRCVGGGAFVGRCVGGGFAAANIDDGKTDERCQREVGVGLFGEGSGEVYVAAGEFLCALLGVDVAEFDQADGVVAETVFLHEEGYEDAVDVEHEIVGIDAVEDVVVELERHLAFDSVGFAQAADLIYFFLLNHIFLDILDVLEALDVLVIFFQFLRRGR